MEGMGPPEVTEWPRKAGWNGGQEPAPHTPSQLCEGYSFRGCGPRLQLPAVLLGGPEAGNGRNGTMEPLNAKLLASAGSGSAPGMP